MAELRRSAKIWIKPRRRIVRAVVHRGPPPEVLAWRECVVSCVRARVGQGLDTKFMAVLLHAWDTVYTGDGRKRDVVEHYHTPACGGNDEECLQQMEDSIDDVLSHIPTLYSRRSWHGQIRTTSHIIILEAIGGLLSQNVAYKQRSKRRPRRDAMQQLGPVVHRCPLERGPVARRFPLERQSARATFWRPMSSTGPP